MKVKIFSIGNYYRRDDGVALVATRWLQRRNRVRCDYMNLGLRPDRLLEYIEPEQAVIIVDAALLAEKQKLFYELEIIRGVALEQSQMRHGLSILQTLQLAELYQKGLAQVWVFGLAAVDLNHGYGLSQTAQNAIKEAVPSIEERVTQLNQQPVV